MSEIQNFKKIIFKKFRKKLFEKNVFKKIFKKKDAKNVPKKIFVKIFAKKFKNQCDKFFEKSRKKIRKILFLKIKFPKKNHS